MIMLVRNSIVTSFVELKKQNREIFSISYVFFLFYRTSKKRRTKVMKSMKTTIRLVRASADNFSCDKNSNNFKYIDNLKLFQKVHTHTSIVTIV